MAQAQAQHESSHEASLLALSAEALGPLYWDAIHRARTPEEVVALTRIFPCCKCRGNYRQKEADWAQSNQPLEYAAAVDLWTRKQREAGGDLLAVTHALHARVNAALLRDPEWPALDVVRTRVRLFPLQPRTVLDVLVTAVASLCRSDCGYDERARAICAQQLLPLDVRCASIALVFQDRVLALKRYVHIMKARVDERVQRAERAREREQDTCASWTYVARVLKSLHEACDLDLTDDPAQFVLTVTDCARALLHATAAAEHEDGGYDEAERQHPLLKTLTDRATTEETPTA